MPDVSSFLIYLFLFYYINNIYNIKINFILFTHQFSHIIWGFSHPYVTNVFSLVISSFIYLFSLDFKVY
jgi:hypothetical protein